MGDRGDEQRCGDDEDQTGVEGIKPSKELARGRPRGIDRTHATQEHGGIHEGIKGGEILEVHVAPNTDTE